MERHEITKELLTWEDWCELAKSHAQLLWATKMLLANLEETNLEVDLKSALSIMRLREAISDAEGE